MFSILKSSISKLDLGTSTITKLNLNADTKEAFCTKKRYSYTVSNLITV